MALNGEPAVATGLGSAAAVLWDIDGTLLLSGAVAARAFLDAVHDVTRIRPSTAGIEFGGRIDPEIAALLLAAVGHDVTHVPAVLARHAELVQQRADELRARTRALAGVEALLHRLAAAGVRQTVVTGNVRSVALLKLAAAEMVPPIEPEFGGYGDSGPDRVEVARFSLLKLFGPTWPGLARQCWIIGDTPRDVACAQALGLRCVLLATGRYQVEALTGLGADVVLSGLDDSERVPGLWRG